MNKYSLDFDKKASKDLLSLDKSVRNFILDELEIFIKFFDEDYEKELIKIAVRSLGLDELSAFNPQERIIEYMLQSDTESKLVNMNLKAF
ncbi:MAG TPA: hypothetical protein PKY07_05125, partial [Aliarcobacter cryaerophilus]|nr:hypothetical protein [Aliarcobacter cryaerophilus]